MKPFRLALTVLLAMMLAGTAAADAKMPKNITFTDADALAWELKGLKLGGSIDQAKATFPQLQCETEAAGVEGCFAREIDFAGGKARILLRYLDGSLVLIKIGGLTRTQIESASLGLVQKFGPASNETMTRRTVGRDLHWESSRSMNWRSPGTMLFFSAYDAWVKDIDDYTGAITLFDIQGHDHQWLPRSEGKPVTVATDI